MAASFRKCSVLRMREQAGEPTEIVGLKIEVDSSLLTPGYQEVFARYAGGRITAGAARFDWVELQLLPRE